MSEFVHLHVHSQYSLLDGAVRVKDLAQRTSELGMRAVALTDHGNMFGSLQHYLACKERGIGAVIGCEINVARSVAGRAGDGGPASGRGDGPPDAPVDHLVLLAASPAGYQSLVRIVSAGHLEPASGRAPSVPLSVVEANKRGLIGLSGCLGGIAAQEVLEQGETAGRAALERLAAVFEPDGFYVELQDHGLPEQPIVNGILASAARDLGLPCVATNDVHFVGRDDGESQLYLGCIAANRSFADARIAHHGSYEMFLKSPDEMGHLFRDHPDAVKATLEIAERCTSFKLKLGEPMLPSFKVPEGFDTDGYFRHVAAEGLARRIVEIRKTGRNVDENVYRTRLEVELDVICGMRFPGYFLIVWDFIRYAKERGIPVGPGRGSGAGSLVAFAMRITDLDPLPYSLLFERFLNPERVSMPDFDVDFCMDRRDEVIAYVAEKYGKRSVGQIATFHELKSRSVIKDVARTMGLPPNEAQRIASLVPQKAPGIMYTIPEALVVEPQLKALVDRDPMVSELVKQAMKLEGLTRHAGMHAAGVVISEGPLDDHVPCFMNGEQIVTQYHKDDVEKAGLVKFDFLGLKTLTVLKIAETLVNARPDRSSQGAAKLEIETLSLDDPATFALLQSGDTTGVFQLESSGMQQLFKDLRPTTFEDIVAAVALYRPGPLQSGMVKDFVDCKHGRKPIQKMHPRVDELLVPTYGVIVYQEQVMQVAQQLAGYTLGGADLLRRAMGKKKAEEMAKQKETFLAGSKAQGVSVEDAERIFGLLEYFAGYGFNKSHSAAYALVTYQTAYMKAHYPVEFLCALMTADRDKIEKVVRIIAEGRAWGVETLPPAINESKIDFTVVYGDPTVEAGARPKSRRRGSRVKDVYRPKIRFGLGAIRGVGEAALEAVLESRAEGGAFRDLFDFAERVEARKVNKGVFEALVASGAFDGTLAALGVSRAQAFASIDRALERARNASKDRERGQTSLFGLFGAMPSGSPAGGAGPAHEYHEAEPWDLRQTLAREKEALGFYVSGHPLDRYGIELARFEVTSAKDLSALDPWARVRVAGMVEGYRMRIFKGGGGKIAFFSLEDTTGRIEVKVRERQIESYEALLTGGEPLLVSGKLSFPQVEDEGESQGPSEPTLLFDEAVLLSDAIRAEARAVTLRLSAARHGVEQIEKLRAVLEDSAGTCPVSLAIELEGGAEALMTLSGLRVEPSDAMFARIEKLLGGRVVELR